MKAGLSPVPRPVSCPVPPFRRSAVLVLLQQVGRDPYFVLTLRTRRVGKHAGEMSFPGGTHEPGRDVSLQDTALRETWEEVGVGREHIDVVGYLTDFPTLTRFCITPVVGVHLRPLDEPEWPYPLSTDEVSEVVLAPVAFFERPGPENFRESTLDFGGTPPKRFPLFSFQYDQFNVWGATAHIIWHLLHETGRPHPPTSGLHRFTPAEILEHVPARVHPRWTRSNGSKKRRRPGTKKL